MSDRVRHQAARPSGLFGQWMGEVMAFTNRPRNRWLVEQLEVGAGLKGLEIGFGNGEVLAAFIERSHDGTAVGIDWSEVMLAAARSRNAIALSSGRLTLQLGDVAQPDCVLGEGYDRIWSSNVIQIVPNRPSLFRRLHLALNEAGLLATCFEPRGPDVPNPRSFASTLEAELRDAGYANLDTRWMPKGRAFCIVARKRSQ